jgi:hypothetical protein
MTGLTGGTPFLYVSDYAYHDTNNNNNDIPENGETINLGLAIANPSTVELNNVSVDISCDDTQIEVTQSHTESATIPAEGSFVTGNAGTFVVSDTAIDQSRILIHVTCAADGNTWTTDLPLYISAPVMEFADITVDDSEGDNNGFIDPGERVIVHINGKNTGHAIAPDAFLTVTCLEEGLILDDSTINIGDVEAGEDFTADLVVTADPDIWGGTVFHFVLALNTGAYTTELLHTFSVGTALETFETGDFSFLGWAQDGDLPWGFTDEEAHTGTYSARSGAIGDDEVTKLYIYADIFVDGEISFWFKTSTQYHCDYFAFYIDNKKKDWWSGENDWTNVSYDLTAGHHCFLWLYDKNRQNQSGSDCAWIDDITFPRASIVNSVEEVVTKKGNALYPNPSTGCFTLELEEESNVNIFNVYGQTVMRLSQVSGSQHIDLSHMPKGLYFVQIQNESNIEIKKLTIE